jgi:lambda family phage minor tail protein L
MTIQQDVLKNEVPGYIELLEVDCSILPGNPGTYYFTTSQGGVTFGGTFYTFFPFLFGGFNISSEGAPARPTVEIANLTGLTGEAIKLIGSLAFTNDDLIGVKVTYIRTFVNYLNLGSRISAPPLSYIIGRKLEHNRYKIKFELRSPIDKERAFLPKRQMLKRDFPGLGINKHIY